MSVTDEHPVYVSDDGQTWRQLAGVSSSFDIVRSLYSITFDLTTTRWLKVVNFGVNSEPSFITELQAFHHTLVAPGGARDGEMQTYGSVLAVLYRPLQRLSMCGVRPAARRRSLPRSSGRSTPPAS